MGPFFTTYSWQDTRNQPKRRMFNVGDRVRNRRTFAGKVAATGNGTGTRDKKDPKFLVGVVIKVQLQDPCPYRVRWPSGTASYSGTELVKVTSEWGEESI